MNAYTTYGSSALLADEIDDGDPSEQEIAESNRNFDRHSILWSLVSQSELRTRRGLTSDDVTLFIECVRTFHRKTVRVYSSMGFVPNSYKGRCVIEHISRDGKTGRISIGWSGASRSFGAGPHVTINNRSVAL